jgi:hypothetical protein
VKRAFLGLAALSLLAACQPQHREATPDEVRAELRHLLPAKVKDRDGWAADMQVAFAALKVEPSKENLCSALAVAEQESNFVADPAVPGLAKIAREEIIRRAGAHGVPAFVVRAALQLDSPNGVSYDERLAHVRTERELSEIFEDLIGSIPLGRRLLASANPVHTGGPMQVSIDFAQNFAARHDYPWPESDPKHPTSVRHKVFTRRGGVYFGIAHLLAYPTTYERPLFRFADYNAGFYASRNAAFQQAVARVSGIDIPLDGDLLGYGKRGLGATERAARAMAWQLDMDEKQIHRDLAKGGDDDFEDTRLWQRSFELADRLERTPLPHARLPAIELHSPKITHRLTTEWFAKRVEQRYRRCMAK